MILVYKYSNGEEVKHDKFINDNKIKLEANGSDKVEIYEIKNEDLYDNGVETGRYVTTILIK